MPQPNSKSRSVLWSELSSGFRCEIEYVEGAVARRTAGEERFSNGDDLVKVSRRRGDKLNDDGSMLLIHVVYFLEQVIEGFCHGLL